MKIGAGAAAERPTKKIESAETGWGACMMRAAFAQILAQREALLSGLLCSGFCAQAQDLIELDLKFPERA